MSNVLESIETVEEKYNSESENLYSTLWRSNQRNVPTMPKETNTYMNVEMLSKILLCMK